MKECYRIKRLFGAYLHNGVTPDERAAVEGHIESCEECAADLRSRQNVLEKLELYPQPDEIPQRTQDNFAWNVYRRIASDTLRRRTRQVFLRRLVLQPSLAVAVIAVLITVGVFRFGLNPAGELDRVPPTIATDEAERRERRAALYVEEFFGREGVLLEREPRSMPAVETSAVLESPSARTFEPSSPDVNRFMHNVLPDSRRRLEDADFINYSLGDRRRALAEYRRIVDHYPGTEAATEAQNRIRTILRAEYSIQVKSVGTGQPAEAEI